jgi:DNA modification methylase
MEVTTVNLDELREDDRNAREHDARNIKEIMRSLQDFGQHRPFVVQRGTNRVLVGNGMLKAMRRLGWTQGAVFFVDDDNEQAIRRALADNRTGELSTWNDDILRELLDGLPDINVPGFSEEEINDILGIDKEAHEDDFDLGAALPDKAITQRGDLIIMGEHRLVCGDSTDAADVAKLMDNQKARLVLTDPPYNVDYGDKAEYLNEYLQTGGNRNTSRILNDKMSDQAFYCFLKAAYERALEVSEPGASIYVFHSEQEGLNFRTAFRDAGWSQRQCLVWVKNSLVLGRQDYQWQHEPVLYGWKPGAAHYFTDDRTQATVIDDAKPLDFRRLKKGELIDLVQRLYEERTTQQTSVLRENRPSRSDEHPTMKPVRLCGRLIANSSKKGDIVYDGFGGSGSTLIAAEQLKRLCRTMELDERYCDVIVARWEAFTGEQARRLR